MLAGAVVLGIGAVSTLATWNDSEWVNGLFSTSSFEVEQNTAADIGDAAWVKEESNPGGALRFTADAAALTPGDAAYAPLALRTAAGSDAATVTLQGAVPAAGTTPGTELWAALDVRVTTSDAPFTCDADGITAGTEIASGKLASVAASTAPQSLAADSGSVQYYCFEIALPAELAGSEDVQGQTAQPAWEFQAVSLEA
ncbi:acyl-CoA dehydrogenase [Pseudoclavibacter endophyticus]|uniref:Acyl-CoA dehydrogenase n=1 Tax=Pseudoclavibacter endophyticus TaxID=1778590 RepID=A0A6H9WVC4_9MICO|nr:acyl-CoA dehydrogenase [Pseudoclavibacter endophyticus]